MSIKFKKTIISPTKPTKSLAKAPHQSRVPKKIRNIIVNKLVGTIPQVTKAHWITISEALECVTFLRILIPVLNVVETDSQTLLIMFLHGCAKDVVTKYSLLGSYLKRVMDFHLKFKKSLAKEVEPLLTKEEDS